jgi:hypothetical protein
MSELLAWANPILLTPVPLRRWSSREQALAQADLLVLPATSESIERLTPRMKTKNEKETHPPLQSKAV